MSTIFIASNDKFSGSSKTKHIQYNTFLLVKDMIAQVNIDVQYEPTSCMWSDVLTKLKQVRAFYKFRGHWINIPESYDDKVERLSTPPALLSASKSSGRLSTSNSILLPHALGIKKVQVRVNFDYDTFFLPRQLLRQQISRYKNRCQYHSFITGVRWVAFSLDCVVQEEQHQSLVCTFSLTFVTHREQRQNCKMHVTQYIYVYFTSSIYVTQTRQLPHN